KYTTNKEILEQNISYTERFCNPEQVTISFDGEASKTAMTAVVSGAEIFIPLAALIDLNVEIARLEKELDLWNKDVERVQVKLINERFISKAPE
ncbi:valine--tRNA ligase, partial [Listeria monocytogenes]|nr:valine--tRNA ligase [Listeria monocytogenes]